VKRWLLALSLSAGCAANPSPPAPPPAAAPPTAAKPAANGAEWLSTLDREHPLVGKVWSARQGGLVEDAVLYRDLAQARFVLLGERHDNPDHHRLQARALKELLRAGRRPAVVFEMLEVENQPVIDRYRAQPSPTAAGFGDAIGWNKSSWPPFIEYQPIFDVVFTARLRIVAGNLARASVRSLVKQGPSALPEAQRRELRLDEPFPAELEAPLIEELRASHCGHLPEQLLAPMALAQHARDAQMARALLGAEEQPAVLVAGSGHARLDRGVPYYLGLEAPGAHVVSLAIIEVEHEQTDPRGYLGAAPFHYLWFTPRASDEDPCAAFRK
jgi:uncharacterized iron-regulated protein